jgi:hypothetical protein
MHAGAVADEEVRSGQDQEEQRHVSEEDRVPSTAISRAAMTESV